VYDLRAMKFAYSLVLHAAVDSAALPCLTPFEVERLRSLTTLSTLSRMLISFFKDQSVLDIINIEYVLDQPRIIPFTNAPYAIHEYRVF
jgi:hypothetical protein